MMVTKVNLDSLPYFKEETYLRELNRLFAVQDDLMPHQVAVATGCGLEEAMEILTLLYDQYLAEALLLVYHNEHLDAPAIALSISEGLPPLPFICSVCEKEINDPKELSYDFLFRLNDKILFVVENDESN